MKFNSYFGTETFCGTLKIPLDYCFENHVNSFIQNHTGLHLIDKEITDKNFEKVSKKLIPGERYQVKIVPIVHYIDNCQQCVNELKDENVAFVGIQGLVLFNQMFPSLLPENGKLISFDVKENLHHNGTSEQVPYMQRCDDEFELIELSAINFFSSLSSRGNSLLLFKLIH